LEDHAPRFKRSVIINKAIEEVFDFATNLDNASKFLPGVTKIEMLTEGGTKRGEVQGDS
jgi:hypothetical protein